MPAGPDGSDVPPGDGQPPPPQGAAVAAQPGEGEVPTGELGIAVTLDQFSGPMDLLLYLVRRTEVDVRDLPITTIADQFATWVAEATDLDLEQAGDFVVMAATLLEIKARMVAPPPTGTEVQDDGEDEYDPRVGLIRKLLAYRAAKEAAFDLDRRDDQRRLRHERGHREVVPDDPGEVDAWELKDLDAGALAHLWFDLLKRIDGLGPRTVIVDDVPMGVRMAQVAEAMRRDGEGRMSQLFAVEPGKVGRVGIVMAVLECTRQRILRVAQGEQYGDVLLSFRPEDDRAVVTTDQGPPDQLPKRQRRPPLVTWTPPDGSVAEISEDGADDESPLENEEQRFLRELEQGIGVERLLNRAADLELGFIAWWEETHPGEPLPPGVVKPAPPAPPEPVAPAPAAAAPAAEPGEAKAPGRRFPPRRPRPGETADAAKPVEGQPQPSAAAADAGAPPAVATPPEAAAPAVAAPEAAAPAVPDPQPVAGADAPAPMPAAVSDTAPLAAPSLAPTPGDPPATPAAAAPDPVPSTAGQPGDPAPAPLAAPDPVAALAADSAAPLPDLRDREPTFAVVPLAPTPPDAPPQSDPVAAVAEDEPEPVGEATAEVAAAPAAAEPVADAPPSVAAASTEAVDAISAEPAIVPEEPEAVVAQSAPLAELPPVVESAPAPVEEAVAASVVQVEPSSEAMPEAAAAAEPVAAAAAPPAPVEVPAEAASVVVQAAPVTVESPAVPVMPAAVAASAAPIAPPPAPPPDPDPDPVAARPAPPDPIPTAQPTRPTPAPSRPQPTRPMTHPRHIKIAALATLWVLSTVALVAWFQRPGDVLALAAQPEAIVARDGELVWKLNLPVQIDAKTPLPKTVPEGLGAFTWRDPSTIVFTPSAALPADAEVRVLLPMELKAAGGFRFKGPEPLATVHRTRPAVAIAAAAAAAPAFGACSIALTPNRMPEDPAKLIAGITVSPDVRFQAAVVDGRIVLSGAFAAGQTYRVVVADSVPAKADDRPLPWSGEIAVPARTSGVRLAAGLRAGAPEIEAVNLSEVVVEATHPDGVTVREILHPAESGRAAIPAWMLLPGENRLVLRWAGGQAEAVCVRQGLNLAAPADAAPALSGGSLPVVVTVR